MSGLDGERPSRFREDKLESAKLYDAVMRDLQIEQVRVKSRTRKDQRALRSVADVIAGEGGSFILPSSS